MSSDLVRFANGGIFANSGRISDGLGLLKAVFQESNGANCQGSYRIEPLQHCNQPSNHGYIC